MKIIIKDGNASKILLEFDSEGIRPMLSTFYCFDIPNAKFMPAYKTGRWDGKIRLFDYKTNTLPTGLVFNLKNTFCKNYGIELIDECGILENYSDQVDIKEVAEFVKSLELPFPPYDHQVKPILHIIKNVRCIIESPTSSGKSLIIYILSEWIKANFDGKVLVIVPRISLAKQMAGDFIEYNGEAPHMIYSGQEKIGIENRVIISTWQSLYKLPREWYDDNWFDMVIIDEVHEAEGKSFNTILENLPETHYRVGLTGTLKESSISELQLESRLGPSKKFISTSQLMEKGIVSKLKINCAVFEYDDDYFRKQLKPDFEYKDEIDFLTKCPERNDKIVKMASNLDGNTLILFKHIEHGKELYEKLKEVSKVPVYYISGETKADEREFVRQLAENEQCTIVASTGVFSTGVSIKRLHYLIKAHPTKAKTTVLQSIGRLLRKSPDGRKAMVIDIVDDLKMTKRKNFALKHAEERLRFYSQEKFNFEIHKIKIKRKL